MLVLALEFKMSGDEEAHAFTAAQFGMLRDFFRTDTIRNEFRGVMLQHFSSSSGPDGKWANLQTETWRRKRVAADAGRERQVVPQSHQPHRTRRGQPHRGLSGNKERFVDSLGHATRTRSITTSERGTCLPDSLCRATISAI